MAERIAHALGIPLVQAIDAYFDARARLIHALVQGDEAAAQDANRESREALGTWLALVVERLDSRNAQTLVSMFRRVEHIEAVLIANGISVPDEADPDG